MSQPNLLELEAPIKICGESYHHRHAHIVSGRMHRWSSHRWSLVALCSTSLMLLSPLASWTIRRYSRTILGSIEALRVWWLPSRGKLPLPWRLCRSWKAEPGDNLPAPSIQGEPDEKERVNSKRNALRSRHHLAISFQCHIPLSHIADQIPRELLSPPWQSRVRLNQPHLWIL